MTRSQFITQAILNALPDLIAKDKPSTNINDKLQVALMYAETAADLLDASQYLEPETLPSRLNNQ